MRIGMSVDVYKPHLRGVTNYVALNKKALEELGRQVFVFTFGGEDYEDDELRVVRSPALPVRDTGYYLGFRRAHRVATACPLRTTDGGATSPPGAKLAN